jgi:hypothetical protein
MRKINVKYIKTTLLNYFRVLNSKVRGISKKYMKNNNKWVLLVQEIINKRAL